MIIKFLKRKSNFPYAIETILFVANLLETATHFGLNTI
jgi:hypothetical protein